MNSSASGLSGDSLYAAGNYFEASIAYERQIFESEDLTVYYHYKYQKALCYKQLKQYGRALDELQPLYFSNVSDSLYLHVSYEQSLCFYLNGEPTKALWKMDEYFHRVSDSTSFYTFMPLRILSYNETQKWDQAKACFLQFVEMQNVSTERKQEMNQWVNELYSKKNLPKMKVVKKAENWSRFIPGSGQMYAGKPGEGMVNFLINASLLVFAGQQMYTGYYFTGYLAGVGFFNKIYHGGVKRAGILAAEKNKELVAKMNHEINTMLFSSFSLD